MNSWWLVSLMAMGLFGWTGGYCFGWLVGVKETEERWTDAVGRKADSDADEGLW